MAPASGRSKHPPIQCRSLVGLFRALTVDDIDGVCHVEKFINDSYQFQPCRSFNYSRVHPYEHIYHGFLDLFLT